MYTYRSLIFFITGNPKESGRVPVYIKVLDVNDNAPEFATLYEIYVCENAKAEQVCICNLLAVKFHLKIKTADPCGRFEEVFFFIAPLS